MTDIERNKEVLESHTIKDIEKKTMGGIIYTLDNLYKEMFYDDSSDLLRLGAVKLSKELFGCIAENMPDDVMFGEYWDTIAERQKAEHKAIRRFAIKIIDKYAELHGFPEEEEARNIIDAVLEEWEE